MRDGRGPRESTSVSARAMPFYLQRSLRRSATGLVLCQHPCRLFSLKFSVPCHVVRGGACLQREYAFFTGHGAPVVHNALDDAAWGQWARVALGNTPSRALKTNTQTADDRGSQCAAGAKRTAVHTLQATLKSTDRMSSCRTDPSIAYATGVRPEVSSANGLQT